ncbi:hypothetical protein [Streptomyces sp. NBC_00059]|uniref:hypothetical protein n=1 Tax=Streptomyces sp. NBC_00059 TaxID=2975635 RepID=UPI00224D0CBD|nr:hypothetical protein [Streptomyces sp. NBC_00059]MCX5410416.1 hypothetical protein [Streptomyces sp. NBC_00059]
MSEALELRSRVRGDIAAIEALRTGPYAPPWTGCADPGRSASGEDFAIVALRVGEDFYDAEGDGADGDGEDDAERMDAAHEAFETERWGVVLALDERWGPHRELSTDAYEEREAEGQAVPPFFAALIELGYSGDLQTWDAGGRTVGVGVGQMDREEPVVLFAVALAPAQAG